VKKLAELEGAAVQDDVRALGQPASSDTAGFTSLSGHTLTINFARTAGAQAFLAKTAAAILELEEWSRIAIIVQVGEHSFPLRAGVEKTKEDLKKLSDAGD